MIAFVLIILVGALWIGLGIAIYKGNLNLIHEYHRNRVSEEDRLPFAKAVGRSLILIGCAIAIGGGSFLAAAATDTAILAKIGGGIVFVGCITGSVLAVAATVKYNKGLF